MSQVLKDLAVVRENMEGVLDEAQTQLNEAAAAFVRTHGALANCSEVTPGDEELGAMATAFSSAMSRALAALETAKDNYLDDMIMAASATPSLSAVAEE